MDPPKISLANSNFVAARQGLHADPAIPELPMSAGLLLVPALHVGGAADGLAVGDLGRLEGDIHAVPSLQTADGDFDMLLSGSRHQKLLGLRIAVEAQREVLFEEFMERVTHAVFVTAALRLDGERDGGFRHFHGREHYLGGAVRQGVAGNRLFELGYGADIARV